MILIKNARVMDPESGFDQVTDILLDGKRIRQIGKVDDVSGIEQVIDASGMIAAPGLIDVSLLYCFLFYFHVHFICLSCCTKFYCDRCFSFLQAFDRSF